MAYDGEPFHGFAMNRGVPTVAGALQDALGRVLGAETVITGAGRTDRGVHAVGQVISFDVPDDADLGRLQHAVNHLCGPAIAVLDVRVAADDFDARFSASARTYRYRILNRSAPDPFLARTAWHVVPPLDVDAMEAAAQDLVGEHDFSSFCRRPDPFSDGTPRSLVRRVDVAEWSDDGASGELLDFWISASAFCHQMVRAVTGTLVEIGRGRRAVDAIPTVLARRDRHAAGQLAPPHGLTLWSVAY